MVRKIRLKKGQSDYDVINRNEYYPVRAGNSLVVLKKWIIRTKKGYPRQKLVLIDRSKNMTDKYSRMRIKAGYDNKYVVYGTY